MDGSTATRAMQYVASGGRCAPEALEGASGGPAAPPTRLQPALPAVPSRRACDIGTEPHEHGSQNQRSLGDGRTAFTFSTHLFGCRKYADRSARFLG